MKRLRSYRAAGVGQAELLPKQEREVVEPEGRFATVPELALRWHVSAKTIRGWFRDEPGVMKWGRRDSRPGKKRAYVNMRIPPWVAERVRIRLSGE